MTAKVDPKQVSEAVRSLYAYLLKQKDQTTQTREKKSLWDDDADISLLIALKATPDRERVKPYRIPLKHSLHNVPGVEICLFTADPQRTYKDRLAKTPVQGITRVIGIGKLRRKFIPYKDKRALLSSYQFFMADKRITSLLPPLLGVKFFEKKKQPVPVNLNLTDENFVKELTQARDSTYLYIKTGPCCAVRVARASFTQQQVVDNILTAIEPIVDKLPKKWKSVQGIFLKTHDSIALPLYNSLPVSQKIILPTEDSEEKKSKKKKRKRETIKLKQGGIIVVPNDDKKILKKPKLEKEEKSKEKKLKVAKTVSALLQEASKDQQVKKKISSQSTSVTKPNLKKKKKKSKK